VQKKPDGLAQIALNESAQIWDESEQQFITAYRRDYRRQKTYVFLNAALFNDTAMAKTSPVIEVPAYETGLLLITLAVVSTPTDIIFNVQFSDDGQSFYTLSEGPFADLRYSTAQGARTECFTLPIKAPYMRLHVVSAGCNSTHTFTATVKIILNG
jgi:hypothetical protein